tara:strand:- start:11115 stop:12053 length:939 start_codon:yes stop_codon:yes gene_type:complete
MLIQDSFQPFFGVVENIKDPEEVGRVQVRCYGYHTENKEFLPTEHLLWFSTVNSNQAGVSGIGESPTGYVQGSTVFGYFLSQDLQDGIVLGSISGKPTKSAMSNLGFNDPDGVYPIYTDESDVNKLARGDSSHELFKIRNQNRRIGVPTAGGGNWDEPEYRNNATYPDNDVKETKSGHVKEYDNTEGNERIQEFHKSGTFYEVDKDGNKIVKIVGDGYEIIAGSKFANVRGDVNLTVEGDVKHYVQGNYILNIDGETKEEYGGSVTRDYSDVTENYGSHTTKAGSRTHIGSVTVNGTFTCNGAVFCTSLIEG